MNGTHKKILFKIRCGKTTNTNLATTDFYMFLHVICEAKIRYDKNLIIVRYDQGLTNLTYYLILHLIIQ